MVFWVVKWLAELGVRAPAVFEYTSTRMMLAALTTLLTSLFLGPRFITKLYAWKIGQPIRMDECPLLGQLHSKKKDTPTMGGLLMLFSMLFAALIWMDWTHPYTIILVLTTVVIGFVGATDDWLKLRHKNTKGLKGRYKLVGQGLFSALIATYLIVPGVAEKCQIGDIWAPPVIRQELTAATDEEVEIPLSSFSTRVYVPFIKEPFMGLTGVLAILPFLAIMFTITGTSNAVNLTDGLDGLATGCLILVAGAFSVIAFMGNNMEIATFLNIPYIEGSGEIAIYLAALMGAGLGFLWYNSHPAQVFMGDTGSLTLGAILGVAAVLLKRELLLAIVGGIFVAETLSVILQVISFRYRGGKRIFLCSPLHHHFEYAGWPETKVVIRFWIIGLLLLVVGIASLKFQ